MKLFSRCAAACVLACALGLASFARADFFDATGGFVPKVSYAETYAESVKTVKIPGDKGDPSDPDDDIPSSKEYDAVYKYKGGISIVASLKDFDLTTLSDGSSISVTLGNYSFSGTLDQGNLDSRKATFVTTDGDPGPPASSSSETVKVSWNDTAISIIISVSSTGPGTYAGGMRLQADDGSGADGGNVDLPSVTLTFGDNAVTRGLIGQRAEKDSSVAKFLPGEDGDDPQEFDFDLVAVAASGAADFTPPPLAFVTPGNNATTALSVINVLVKSDASAESVSVHANGDDFVPATQVSSTTWIAAVNLTEGDNVLEAYAVDFSGNQSDLISRFISYEPLGGAFVALLTDDNGATQGRLELKVSKTGAVSGKVYLRSGILSVRGTLDSLILKGKGAQGLALLASLSNDFSLGSVTSLTGSLVGLAAGNLTVSGAPAPYDGKNQIFTAFTYATMLLQPAGGSEFAPSVPGFATVKASAKGSFRVVGKLPDNTSFSFSGPIDASQQLDVFAPLYKRGGSLGGAITVDSALNFAGSLFWDRPAARKGLFTDAFTLLMNVAGNPYTPGTRVKIPADPETGDPGGFEESPSIGYTDGLAIFSDGDLVSSVDTGVSLLGNGKVVTDPDANPGRLKLSVKNSTGIVSGTFIDPDSGRKRTLAGVVIASSGDIPGQIGGFFLGATQVGSFSVVPPAQ